jgi:hypothetical protein
MRSIDENFPPPSKRRRNEEKTRERFVREFNSKCQKFFYEVSHFYTKGRYFVNTTRGRSWVSEKRAKEKESKTRDDDFRYFLVQIVRVYIQVWVCSPPRARSFLSLSVSLSLSRGEGFSL